MEISSIILLTSFLGVVYLLVIILVIILHKRNKEYMRENPVDTFFGGFGCCVSNDPFDNVLWCICAGLFFFLYPFMMLIVYTYADFMRKRADRDSEELEIQEKERKQREIKEFEENLQKKRKDIVEKTKKLRASGFEAESGNPEKVIELASIRPKISLSWMSETTGIPEEEIIIIIEDEPDFEIRDEYIINKKKMLEKEDKIKIAKITCPNCENLFEPGSEFCSNCGHTL